MATRNNRDVRMTLSVETLGTEEIKKLQTSVAELAREGGSAAPEFERLADEIGRLGQQADAIRAFQQLADETDQLSQKQAEAAQRSDELNQRLRNASDAAVQAAQRQREAQSAFDASRDSLRDINGQLTILRNTYDENGNRVANYKSELERLTRAKVEQKDAVELNRRALAESNNELRDAEAAQRKYEGQIKRTEATLDAANRKLAEGRTALDEQRKATEAIGVTTEDLARAQATLVTALNSTGQAADRLRSNLAFVDETMKGSVAATERYEQALLQQAEARERAAAAAAAEAAEERRVADLKQQIQQRLILLANEREQREIEATQRITQEAYRRETAEFERVRRVKEEITNRLVSLARERADRETAEAERAAAAVRKSAEEVSNAFSTVGVRGVSAVQQEIQEVQAAMRTLANQADLTGAEIAGAMSAGNARIAELEREIRGLTGQLTLADRAAEAFNNSLGQIAAGNLIADAVGALVERVKEMGRQFIIVNAQVDTARRALVAMYKDADIAAQQLQFLRDSAQSSGISISGVTNDFIKFSAATRTSNIPLEETNALFEAVTRAAGTLGLGAERTGLALNALAQIASKGTVSMEELRQQLGDSIPGALSLTAQGLGIAESELIKLIEAGELSSRDFFPAFTKGLQTLQGDTESMRNTWERFKNSLTIAATNVGDAGGIQVLTGAIRVLNTAVGLLTLTLQGFIELVFGVTKSLALLAGGIRTLTNPLEEISQVFQEAGARIRETGDAIDRANGRVDEAAEANKRLAGAAAESTASIADQAQRVIANAEGLRAQAAAAANTALGQQALKTATDAVTKAAQDGTNAWVMLNAAMTSLIDTAERQIVVAGKESAAAEIQAKTVERLAALRGDERAELDAAVQASTINLTALENERVKRQQLVDVLTVQLNERIKLVGGSAEEVAARQREIVALQQKIDLAQVEAQRSREAVANAQLEATSRAVVRQTYEDNSRALDQLRAAMDAANVAVTTLVAAEREGVATTEQVNAARETAAVATALYNDAVKDLQVNLRAANELERANFSLKESGVKVMIAQKQAELEIAQARGENSRAARLQNEIRQLEIELIRVGVEAKRTEAQATIAAAKADRARLEAAGELTEAQRLAIDASIAKAEVMLKEAEIAEITADKLEELSRITRDAGGAARSATSDYESLADSLRGVGDAAESAARSTSSAAESTSSIGGSSGGGSGGSGSLTMSPTNFAQMQQKIRAGTLGVGDLELVKAALEEQQFLADTATAFNFRNSQEAVNNAQEARRIFQTLQQQSNASQAAPTPSQSSVGAGTAVTINLGGQSTRVNVASQQDAQNLTSIFQQLESSAGRTFA